MGSMQIHTPSAGGVVIHDDKVLVIYSEKRQTYEFPKGTIDEGESKEAAALREVKEETGYEAEIVESLGDITYEFNSKDGIHYQKTVTYFLMKPLSTKNPQPNLQKGEDFTASWMPIDEALNTLTYEDTKELLKEGVKRCAYITK